MQNFIPYNEDELNKLFLNFIPDHFKEANKWTKLVK